MLRKIVHAAIRFLFALLTRLTILGLENVPQSGGAILAANHMSRLDAPLVFCVIDRTDVTGLITDKYRKNKRYFWIRWLAEAVDAIFINREQVDFQALRLCRDYLQAGHVLGIAPEGTRSQVGALTPAKTGVAYLAEKAGAPIVPVAIWGTERAVAQLLRFRRQPVFIRFGAPFTLPRLARGDRSAMLQTNTDQIMCRIAAMLPERYHGAYAGFPCPEAGKAEQPALVTEADREAVPA